MQQRVVAWGLPVSTLPVPTIDHRGDEPVEPVDPVPASHMLAGNSQDKLILRECSPPSMVVAVCEAAILSLGVSEDGHGRCM